MEGHVVGTNIICFTGDETWGPGVRKDLSKVISHVYNRAGVWTQNTCLYQPVMLPLYWVHTLITSGITHYFKHFLAYLSVELGVSALRIGSELHLFVFWAPTAGTIDSRCCDNKWSTSQQGKKTRTQEEMGILDKFRWNRKDARSPWENHVALIGGLFWFCVCVCWFVLFQVKLRPSWMTCQRRKEGVKQNEEECCSHKELEEGSSSEKRAEHHARQERTVSQSWWLCALCLMTCWLSWPQISGSAPFAKADWQDCAWLSGKRSVLFTRLKMRIWQLPSRTCRKCGNVGTGALRMPSCFPWGNFQYQSKGYPESVPFSFSPPPPSTAFLVGRELSNGWDWGEPDVTVTRFVFASNCKTAGLLLLLYPAFLFVCLLVFLFLAWTACTQEGGMGPLWTHFPCEKQTEQTRLLVSALSVQTSPPKIGWVINAALHGAPGISKMGRMA